MAEQSMRHHLEKSLSVDDPETMGVRKGQRKMPMEPTSDDRRRVRVHEHLHDPVRGESLNAYHYGSAESRGYQNQQNWNRCARSLELSMDAQEFRRSSLNEGERIKIVIDDVDAGAKGKCHFTVQSVSLFFCTLLSIYSSYYSLLTKRTNLSFSLSDFFIILSILCLDIHIFTCLIFISF